jgi:hypothetical protein
MMERSGLGTSVMLVVSEAVAGVGFPPPETVTTLMTVGAASIATLTAKVIGG